MSIDRVIHDSVGYEDAGMHFESELRMMNRICDGIHVGVIVSIGSYRGQMDCALALHAHVPVYCIDPRQNWVSESREFGDIDRQYWMQNVMALGLAGKVRPIELPSLDVAKVWNKPVSLLWIDGNHVEVAVDIDAWMPHVVDGGIIAVHDNNSPHILAAVTSRDDIVEIERADLTTVYRKEPLYEPFEYDGLKGFVRKGPYNHDDKYVWGEVRSYDIGTEPIRTCIDIGGHIGAFSAWILKLYPDAKVVAVEPEHSNFSLLLKNATGCVDIIHGHVNYDYANAVLEVNPINSGCHRMVARELVTPGQSVIDAGHACTIESIMREQGWDTLDLLKLDCEGAEVDILSNCSEDVLRNTRRIVGEFHAGHGVFLEGIGARLQRLGFDVKAELNPAAHATFVAVNQNWQEKETPIEYRTPAKAKPGRKAKK